MEYNTTEIVIPESPKVTPNEVLFVYVPTATYDKPGVAIFRKEYFTLLSDGTVIPNGGGIGRPGSNETGEIFNDYDNNIASGNYTHAEGRNTKSTGSCSHAQNNGTNAIGENSHAEGYKSWSVGSKSHSGGNSCIALGASSYASGERTIAFHQGAHAEGGSGVYPNYEGDIAIKTLDELYTAWLSGTAYHVAGGIYSHVEGHCNFTYGKYSHAEGMKCLAGNDCAHAEGNATKALAINTHTEGRGCIASADNAHAEGDYTEARGPQSHTEGYKTIAEVSCNHAEGRETKAIGYYTHTEGAYNEAYGGSSHVEGGQARYELGSINAVGGKNIAYGGSAHAEGMDNVAGTDFIHYAAHAQGRFTKALKAYTHAEGYGTQARADAGHTEGSYTVVLGPSSHAEGENRVQWESDWKIMPRGLTEDGTLSAFVIGPKYYWDNADTPEGSTPVRNGTVFQFTTASENIVELIVSKVDEISPDGSFCALTGDLTILTELSQVETADLKRLYANSYSGLTHTEGRNSSAAQYFCHVEGESSISAPFAGRGPQDHSIILYDWKKRGKTYNLALGYACHVEGKDNLALMNNSHAEGEYNCVRSVGGHVEGAQNFVEGVYSHGEGYLNTIEGTGIRGVHVEGVGNVAKKEGQHVGGTYSEYVENAVVIYGNGTNNLNRSNAFWVTEDGDVYAGNGGKLIPETEYDLLKNKFEALVGYIGMVNIAIYSEVFVTRASEPETDKMLLYKETYYPGDTWKVFVDKHEDFVVEDSYVHYYNGATYYVFLDENDNPIEVDSFIKSGDYYVRL